MSEEVFRRCSSFIQGEFGIKMPPAKKTMLESRLRKRMTALGITGFDEYVDYVFSDEGSGAELINMVDAVTTNKTEFFREAIQFDILRDRVLADLTETIGAGARRPLRAWSAGCSTGEEPYTLAMVLEEHARSRKDFQFHVLATDLSSKVLAAAVRGVFPEERIAGVPAEMKRLYFMKSRDRSRRLVRVVPELRSRVTFHRLNLMESDFGIGELMDVIFCRNVLIYFDKATQENLILRLCSHLAVGGYLFLGHSELLHGMTLPLQQAGPMMYRRIP